MTERWFAHSGDLGDVIYSLPTIRAMGGGTLYLFDFPGRTREPMTHERASLLRPLLLCQDYIHGVVYQGDLSRDHDLNGFRDHLRNHWNLADAHLGTHGLAWQHRASAWLAVSRPRRAAPVVFHRSARYRNELFPWKAVFEKYGNDAVFVGTAAEHAQFCDDVGAVPFHPTADLLGLAEAIAGASLFVGNQSCPLAVAEGLKRPVVAELLRGGNDNCRFDRMTRINGYDHKLELPDLHALGAPPVSRPQRCPTPAPTVDCDHAAV